jgi:hypothetical protein
MYFLLLLFIKAYQMIHTCQSGTAIPSALQFMKLQGIVKMLERERKQHLFQIFCFHGTTVAKNTL